MTAIAIFAAPLAILYIISKIEDVRTLLDVARCERASAEATDL